MKPSSAIADFLKTLVPLFAHFLEERLEKLVDGSLVASFEPNEAVVHHGARSYIEGIHSEG